MMVVALYLYLVIVVWSSVLGHQEIDLMLLQGCEKGIVRGQFFPLYSATVQKYSLSACTLALYSHEAVHFQHACYTPDYLDHRFHPLVAPLHAVVTKWFVNRLYCVVSGGVKQGLCS